MPDARPVDTINWPALITWDDLYEIDDNGSLHVEAIDGVLANDNAGIQTYYANWLWTDWFPTATKVALARGGEPEHGTVQLNEDGSFIYTPDPYFFGQDRFFYRITDSRYADNSIDSPTGGRLYANGAAVFIDVGLVDIDTDSDNDNGFAPPDRSTDEERIEDSSDSPGKLLSINPDADNDGVPDYADGFGLGVASTDYANDAVEFVPIVIEAPTWYTGSTSSNDWLSLELIYDASDPSLATEDSPAPGSLRLWTSPYHRTLQELPDQLLPSDENGYYVAPQLYTGRDLQKLGLIDGNRITLYVESVRASQSVADQSVQVIVRMGTPGSDYYWEDSDTVRFTSIGLDVDVDSDNDGDLFSVDRDEFEEKSEDIAGDAGTPGKLLLVTSDADADGVPDYADGFGLGQSDTDQSNDMARFAPVRIEIPQGINLNNIVLTLDYDASDPAGAAIDNPANGSLRLWTESQNRSLARFQDRESIFDEQGYFVNKGSYTGDDLRKLGFTDEDRTITLYMEAVRVSQTIGDQRLVVKAKIGDQELTDAVRFTSLDLDLFVEPRGSVDDPHADVGVLLSPFDAPDLIEALDGILAQRQVSFSYAQATGPASSNITDGWTGVTIDTPTSVTASWNVTADVLGYLVKSKTFQPAAGLPDHIEASPVNADNAPVVAGSNRIIQLEVKLFDKYNNPVADGTPVTFMPVDWITKDGDIFPADDPPDAVTTNGIARAYVMAPAVPASDKLQPMMQVWSGDMKKEFDATKLQFVAATATVTGPASIQQNNATQANIFTVTTNAADGTPVIWTVSNGLANGQPSTYQTVVLNGESTLDVRALGNGAFVGDGVVTATIGYAMGIATYSVTPDSEYFVKLDDQVIVGDEVVDETTDTLIANVYENPNDPYEAGFEAKEIKLDRPVTLKTSTNVHFHGKPDTLYEVSVPVWNEYFGFAGVDGSNQFRTDANGDFTFQMHSTGKMAGDLLDYAGTIRGEPDIIRAQFVVRDVATGDEIKGNLTAAKSVWYATTWDCVQSFFGGDAKTMAGVAANMAGGFLIVGDVGTLVKNSLRAAGFFNAPVDPAEVILSGIGLAAELAFGWGKVVDAPVTAARGLLQLGKAKPALYPLTQSTAVLIQAAVTNVQTVRSIPSLLMNLGKSSKQLIDDLLDSITNDDVLKQIGEALDNSEIIKRLAPDPDDLPAGQSSVDQNGFEVANLGHDDEDGATSDDGGGALLFAAAIDDAFTSVVKFLRSDATRLARTAGIGADVSKAVGNVITGLKGTSADLVNGLSKAARAKFVDDLGFAIAKAKLEPSALTDVLNLDIWKTYKIQEFADDIAKIAGDLNEAGNGAIKGLQEAINHLKGDHFAFKWGRLYELRAAGEVIKVYGQKIIAFNQRVSEYFDDFGKLVPRTDLDIVTAEAIYQVKRSAWAFCKVKKGTEFTAEVVAKGMKSTMNWIKQAKRADVTKKVVYLTPDPNSVPGQISALITREGGPNALKKVSDIAGGG